MTIAEVARLIDEFVGTNCDTGVFVEALRAREPSGLGSDETLKAAATAMHYDLDFAALRADRRPANPFVPEWGAPEEHFQWIKSEKPELLDIWAQLSELVTSPAASARLHDLMWVFRHGVRPHEHAQQAIAAYVDTAEVPGCEAFQTYLVLDRALTLSKSLKADSHLSRIVEQGQIGLGRVLARDDAPTSHMAVWFLTLLTDLPESHRPPQLGEQLDAWHVLFEQGITDPQDAAFERASLFELQQRLAKGDRDVAHLRREAAEMWLARATEDETPRRLVALEEAERWASGAAGESDILASIRRLRQGTGRDAFEWHRTEIPVTIPSDVVEQQITLIVGADRLDDALVRFAQWGPPTGDPATVEVQADEELAARRFSDLFPKAKVHPSGFVIKEFRTPLEKRQLEIAQGHTWRVLLHSQLAVEVLNRIGRDYERDLGQLSAHFASDLIWPPEAAAFARSFEHFWAGRHDEAILVALPRVEAVVRRMAAITGAIVYTPPQGDRAGALKALGEVLRILRGRIEESWWQAFWFILVDPIGLNLRNEYVHGLRSEGSPQDAALILHLAAHLRLYEAREAPAAPTETSEQAG